MVTFSDISNKKREENAYRETSGRFESLVDDAPDAIYLVVAGRFAYINRAALKLLGAASSDELLEQPVAARFPVADREGMASRIEALHETSGPIAMIKETYIRLDGGEIPVEVTAVPTTFKGKPGALVFVREAAPHEESPEDPGEVDDGQKHNATSKIQGKTCPEGAGHVQGNALGHRTPNMTKP